ncbi:MAG: FGGY family carbohydrate kinase [Ornithinibacter sp.]
MSTTVDVGVDLGTTVTKAVALDGARRVVARASLPTPWERPRAEWCERDPADAVPTVDRLLADLVRVAGDVQVRSVGFCSIAETGALVDAGGSPVSRLLAWHDPRGGRQAAALDPALAAVLPSRTGLAVSAVATFFKLLWWRDEAGLDLADLQWLGLPELVCHGLGAGRFAEHSMLGRTALWDIHDEALFEPALDALGTGPELVPPRVTAGAALGRVRADHPVVQARGAVLTVAGHDHLVAAAALGAGGVGSLCDSMGTAEALVAAVGAPPPPRVVAGLVSRGLSVYPHVVDSTTCLLGALRTGLVLGRALDALGATTTEQRLAFDAGMPAATHPAAVTVEGLDMSDDHVTVAWPEDTDPYAAWAGVLARTRGVVASEVAAIRAVDVPVDEVVLTGGWAKLSSVAASRHGIAQRTQHVTLEEPGATGAALLARWAATRHPEGSDPTTHEAPQPGWFTDPSA